jgi:hypothetical protein
MFIGDEVRAEASPAAATARLAALARGSSLAEVSRAAWDAGTARPGHPGPVPATLARALWDGPRQRGPASVLIIRWEAAGPGGRPFTALDADIILIPDDEATLVGLTGVFRPPPGTPPGDATAATVIRALLTRIAGAVSDTSAPPAGRPRAASLPTGQAALPGTPPST